MFPLTPTKPCISENYIKTKAFIKLFETPQRKVKIKMHGAERINGSHERADYEFINHLDKIYQEEIKKNT